MAHDVFICHSSEDRAIADKACAALEAEGVKCWIAPRDVVPGSVWAASITSAIKDSRLRLLIYSRHANDSMQVLRELELATSNNILILPLRIENAAPTDAIAYYIGAAHWLDAFSPAQVEKHLNKLTNAVRQHLGISRDTSTKQEERDLQPVVNEPEKENQKDKARPIPRPIPEISTKNKRLTPRAVLAIASLVTVLGAVISYWQFQPDTDSKIEQSEKVNPSKQAEELVTQAFAFIDKGELDKADELLKQAAKLDTAAGGYNEARKRLEEARRTEAVQQAIEERQRKEEAEREKIKLLLVSAEQNLAANRLTLPIDRNALHDYQAVLQLDPNNSKAARGIEKIVQRYVVMAQDALKVGELTKAGQMLAKVSSIDPETKVAVSLRKEIDSRKSQAKTHMERALALIENKDLVGAEKEIEKAVALDKDFTGLDEARKRLAAVRREAAASTMSRNIGKVFQDKLKSGELGPKMVVLPAGGFLMGSTKETDGDERYDDERQHHVTIEKPFAIGQYPVTNAQYRQFTYHDSRNYEGHSLNNDAQPVVYVRWHDAVAYTKWLSEQTGKAYRLPTETEWEYAARAGTTTRRFWGDDPDQGCGYANVRDQTFERVFSSGWAHHDRDDGYAVTSPVGRFKPNDFKLYDMLGNVWEWTCSEYDRNYGGAEMYCQSEGDASRSLRSGSWFNPPRDVRSAWRNKGWPSERSDLIGFRLAQDI